MSENKELLLVGNLNCDVIKASPDPQTRRLQFLCSLYQIEQLINEPTRVTRTSATQIDIFLTNRPENISSSGVIHLGTSDHSPIYAVRKCLLPKSRVNEDGCTPILGNSTIQVMELVQIQYHNILSVETKPITQEALLKEYPDVFQGTGKLEGQYNLEVKQDAQPVVHPPWRVPVALNEKLKGELERLQYLGIIAKVLEPWVSSLVSAQKPNGKLHVCIDPKDLNQALRRSHYPTPTIYGILPELEMAKVSSTVDVKKGSVMLSLATRVSRLTTFNSPIGRFPAVASVTLRAVFSA